MKTFIANDDGGHDYELHTHYERTDAVGRGIPGVTTRRPDHITTETGQQVFRRSKGVYELSDGTILRSSDRLAP